MDNNELLQKLADIEQPAPPEWQGFILLCIIAALMLSLVTWALWYRHRQQQNKNHSPIVYALALLDETHTRWSSGDIDDRETAYCLSTLLRLALGLKQIGSTYPSVLENNPDQHKLEWKKTMHLFSQIRYQASTPARLNAEIFQSIKDWLNTLPQHKTLNEK